MFLSFLYFNKFLNDKPKVYFVDDTNIDDNDNIHTDDNDSRMELLSANVYSG